MSALCLRRPSLREWRLATGLVLFGYILTHLLNHALGNVSLHAMVRGLDVAATIWLGPVGIVALYASLVLHAGLGLSALYGRRSWRMRPTEALQLGLGLAIPALLVNHVTGTRIADIAYGLGKDYPQQLYVFWVQAPLLGLLQATLLLVAWIHGCVGVHFWLCLKPGYDRVRDLLLAGAVLVPVLSLLGFAQGGRAVAILAADPAWREIHVGPDRMGTRAQAAHLLHLRNALLAGYGGALALVLIARAARNRRRRGLVALTYPEGRVVRVARGTSVLEASRLHGIPHASVCGGKGRCSTCRVRVLGDTGHLPPPSAEERTVLDRIAAHAAVRLACQLRPTRDLTVMPLVSPQRQHGPMRAPSATATGEERFVVAAFIDMRGSTRLAADHLPFDAVFIINRFLTAVARAVVDAGGVPNQFLGDGLLALFGLSGTPRSAATQALSALDSIIAAVDALNAAMAGELDRPIGFGIGLHAGTAVVGEIGDGAHTAFTAIGDPVNVASRLQDLTKSFGCLAVVSEAVYAAAGREPEGEGRVTTVRGGRIALSVRLLHPAAVPSAASV